MIPSERMQQIMKELTVGKPPQAQNDEEREFIEKVRGEIADARAKGAHIEIPGEWP